VFAGVIAIFGPPRLILLLLDPSWAISLPDPRECASEGREPIFGGDV